MRQSRQTDMRPKCAAANPAIASLLQSSVLVGRVAELGSFGAMKRRLLLGCLSMLVLIALGIFGVRFASQGPELAVGSTVKDPWKYFTAKVEARPDGRFRQTLCGSPAIDTSQGTIINYVTIFSYAPQHTIASRRPDANAAPPV